MKRMILAALCLAATMAQARSNQWTIIDLGALGASGSVALALNNRGDVAGYSRARAPGDTTEAYHGFLYQNGAMYDLGAPAGSAFAQVSAMNENGTLVAIGDFGMSYLWKGGAWSPMNFHGTPRAINRLDEVVGNFQVGAAQRAFLYSEGVAVELGTLGGTSSRANAINDRGIIVGNASLSGDATTHAFVFENDRMRDIGTLGGTYSTANDINSSGVVVGGSHDVANRMTAFIYDSAGMRPLLNIPGTHSATAINDRGAVVGLIDEGGFLYDNGILTRLDRLPEVVAAGWTSIFPAGITERGWIAGWGWHADGRPSSAFLMIPPAPMKVWTR
jgi:probable HAF family extracellular repeat protein